MDFLQILQMNILLDVINNGEEKVFNGNAIDIVGGNFFHFYGKCQRQSN